MAVTTGSFTSAFLAWPGKVEWHEFAGIAFIIIALAIYWAHFVNDVN